MSIEIEHNKKYGRFELAVPFDLNGLVSNMPSRRWNKVARKWFAPAVRVNAKFIVEQLQDVPGVVVSTEAKEVIAHCLTQANKQYREQFPAWYQHKLPPRDYQKRGLDKLFASPAAGLFMVMGSGKSKMTIDLLSARAMSSGDININAAIIACPFSIRDNWLKQFKEHCPIEYHATVLDPKTIAGKRAYESLLVDTERLRVLIVGIESMSTGQAPSYVDKFANCTSAAMVVDESSRIKNHSAKRTRNIVSIGKRCRQRIIMTGTPVTQGLIDLYSQMQFLSGDILGVGDFYSFRNTYAIMGGFNGKEIIGYRNTDELMDLIKPYVFHVSHDDALSELPDRTYMERIVPMTPEQLSVYKSIKNDKMILMGDRELAIQNALETLLRLQQVTGGFTVNKKVDPVSGLETTVPVPLKSNKASEVIAIAQECDDSMIVWCRFRPEIALVAAELCKVFGESSVVEFHGGIDSTKRWDNVQAFESKKARFFVANQSTGGIGLDLLAATVVVFYSNTYSYEDRVQSEARNHRIGQKHPVTYIDLQCEKTIDSHVLDILKDKGTMAAYVRDSISAGTNPVTAITS